MTGVGKGVAAERGTLRIFVTQQLDHVLVRIYNNVKKKDQSSEVFRSIIPASIPEGIRTRDCKQAGQHGGCLARTRKTMPSVVSSAATRINCPWAGREFLARSLRWLTSSTYRTCQVPILRGSTESAEYPKRVDFMQTPAERALRSKMRVPEFEGELLVRFSTRFRLTTH